MAIGTRMLRVGDGIYPSKFMAELSPAECAPALKAVALATTIAALRLYGGNHAEFRDDATTAYRAFIAALVPTAPPEVVAELDYDELASVVEVVIAAEGDHAPHR